MENTRQILKVKFNKNINEVNEIINSYLKASKFIEIDYNGEKVLKHNSFMTKLDFFKTYIKIHLSNNELTLIGWVVWKGVEYGFDDELELDEPYKESNLQVSKNLFNIFFAFASGLNEPDGAIICKKVNSNEAIFPNEENKFILK